MEKKQNLTVYERNTKERIRQLVDEFCGGSQQVFADRVGINKASVSQYVKGKNTPGNITAKKIAVAFGVNPAWVHGFSDDMYDGVRIPVAPVENKEELRKNALLMYYLMLNEHGKEEAVERIMEMTLNPRFTDK